MELLLETSTMDKTPSLSLGERILLVARMAVEEHLAQTVRDQMQSERQAFTGGAGWAQVTEDRSPFARGRALCGTRAARFAEGEAA
jgi:hypothetical protein